jgi:protein involved in polysaccharide export with SLBB domain
MPGPQDIPSDEVLTLSKAILRAGGFTDFADRKNVKVTRQEGGADKQTFVVDVGEIFDKGKTENDVALKPGDLIYIPERMIRF